MMLVRSIQIQKTAASLKRKSENNIFVKVKDSSVIWCQLYIYVYSSLVGGSKARLLYLLYYHQNNLAMVIHSILLSFPTHTLRSVICI